MGEVTEKEGKTDDIGAGVKEAQLGAVGAREIQGAEAYPLGVVLEAADLAGAEDLDLDLPVGAAGDARRELLSHGLDDHGEGQVVGQLQTVLGGRRSRPSGRQGRAAGRRGHESEELPACHRTGLRILPHVAFSLGEWV